MPHEIWITWLELAPWLLLGAAIAGLLHALLPPSFLERRLAGRQGVTNAVLLGVPLPLCSCGVIPTGLGLKTQGASDGATVGFLISTPQTGVDSVLVTASFLGWPFALFKVAWAAATGLIGGWWADSASPSAATNGTAQSSTNQPTGSRVREAIDHAIEMLRSIWRWIVIGVLLSAVIATWLPTAGLAALSSYGGLPAMLAALVISLPLYVCATASVPIAASLVNAGLPAGAALVFLMAGPATNVATIGAVYRALGRRQLVVYLATIIGGSILGGLLFGQLVATSTDLVTEHVHKTPWWAVACGLLLAALFAWFALEDLIRLLKHREDASTLPSVTVGVEGMTCGGCVAKLEKAIARDPAVDSVDVHLKPGEAVARGTITVERLKQLVRDAGFTTP